MSAAPCATCPSVGDCALLGDKPCNCLATWREAHADLRRDDLENAERHRHDMQDKADRSPSR